MSSEPKPGLVPLSVPHLAGREQEYLRECVASGWVSSAGPFVERFEKQFAEAIGARYAVATASGTAALHIGLLLAGIQPEDEVLVSTLTFIAPANTIRYVGAVPLFIDAEPDFWQMDVGRVAAFLQQDCVERDGAVRNRVTGRRVTAIVPVHILGHPVDMDPLLALAERYHLRVIEDATESLGAQYRGKSLGRLGDCGCFSFNGNKIITTGGGGMLVTNNAEWAQRARYLTTQAKDDGVEYIHRTIGYNYRLTNLQASVGCAQLEQLAQFVDRKREIAAQYQAALGDLPGLTLMREAPWAHSTFWLYTILVGETPRGIRSRALLEHLARAGIQTRPLWQPIHLSPAHAHGLRLPCPVAERLYHQALSLPSSVSLTAAEQARVCDALRAAVI